MAKLQLSPPWVEYFRQIQCMFKEDPEVYVDYDEDENKVILSVRNGLKALALEKLLPAEKEFGNVKLFISIDCIKDNIIDEPDVTDITAAFEGNGIVDYVYQTEDVFGGIFTFVVFAPKIAQYFCDNLTDPNGYRSMLYEDIARDLFKEIHGVFYCTGLDLIDKYKANFKCNCNKL